MCSILYLDDSLLSMFAYETLHWNNTKEIVTQCSISKACCFVPHVPGMCHLSDKLLAPDSEGIESYNELYTHAYTQFSLQCIFHLGCCISLNWIWEDALFHPSRTKLGCLFIYILAWPSQVHKHRRFVCNEESSIFQHNRIKDKTSAQVEACSPVTFLRNAVSVPNYWQCHWCEHQTRAPAHLP